MKAAKAGGVNLPLVFLWFLVVIAGIQPLPAAGAYSETIPEPKEPPAKNRVAPLPPGALDFDSCVQLALRQSPHLIKSDLEIKIRRLDETDSKTDFFPSFNLRVRYYLTTPPGGSNNNSPYYVDFSSDPYNPVESYFTLKARKIITKIAILSHLKVISEGLWQLGELFLLLDALHQLAEAQKDLLQLAEKNLTYQQERLKIGEGTALDLRLASQELELAGLEYKKMREEQRKAKDRIHRFLALPAGQELSLNLPAAKNQLLGNIAALPEAAEEVETSSFDFKIQALQRELQQYNISLARARLLPTFYMGAVTPDPLSGVQNKNFYVFGGAFVPLWDGFKRVRNITRQKTVLKQMDADATEREASFREKWRTAQENLLTAAAQVKMSQSQLELAILKGKQLETRYRNLGEPLLLLLEGEKGIIDARKNAVWKSLEYDKAKLSLRYLSNNLVLSYVNENSIPKRFEDKP